MFRKMIEKIKEKIKKIFTKKNKKYYGKDFLNYLELTKAVTNALKDDTKAIKAIYNDDYIKIEVNIK